MLAGVDEVLSFPMAACSLLHEGKLQMSACKCRTKRNWSSRETERKTGQQLCRTYQRGFYQIRQGYQSLAGLRRFG